MLFSILIPVYNAEKYLRASVQSVLVQTERDFEIILCDDASTDSSTALGEELAEMHPGVISVIRNEVNQGQLLTRRHLFAVSKGDYILCLDADDELEPNALAALKEAVLKTSADLIVYNALCVHTDQRIEHFKPSLIENHLYQGEEKTACLEAIFQNSYLNSLCTKVFRRELLDLSKDYSQWKGMTLGEDLFQSYPLFDRAEKIYYLNQDLYRYYKRENGVTAVFTPRIYAMRKLLWAREDQYMEAWKLSPPTVKRIYWKRCHETINFVKKASPGPYPEFVKTAKPVSRDECFVKALGGADLTGRYRWYGHLLYKKKFGLLYIAMKTEGYLVRIKDHRSV